MPAPGITTLASVLQETMIKVGKAAVKKKPVAPPLHKSPPPELFDPFTNRVPKASELPLARELPDLGNKAKVKEVYPRAFEGMDDITDPVLREHAEAVITRQLGFGYNDVVDPAIKAGMGTMMGVQAVTKLGLSQIAQATQFLTPAAQVGFKDSVRDVFRLADKDPEIQDRLLRTGAFLTQMIRDSHQVAAGETDWAARMLKLTGFTYMDTAARKYAALRAFSVTSHQSEQLVELLTRLPKSGEIERNYIRSSIGRIEKKLMEMGLDAEAVVKRGGVVTEEEMIRAGLKFSTDVNFWGDSLSLPVFWKSPWGRLLTQFKSFIFQQTKYLKDHVIFPAFRDGDIGPLIRLTPTAFLGGEAINDIKALVRNRPRESEGAVRIVENMASMGYFGIFADAVAASEDPSRTYAAFLGPNLSDAADVAYGVGQAGLHGNFRPLAKKTVKTAVPFIPGVGPIVAPGLANTLFPPKKKKKGRLRRKGGDS